MLGSVRAQPTVRLLELALHPDAPPALGLVPRDRDVNEPLQEVAFLGRRRAPCILELLVRGEVLAAPDQVDAGFKS
jgi:hypothetical protein